MILVCGEALIDLFVGAREKSEMPARAIVGGSPFNLAIGLSRLDVQSSFFGSISRDRFGTLLSDTLAEEGVDNRFLIRTDRLSTITVVSTGSDGQPSYAFHGEGAADRSLELSDLPAVLPDEIQALTFGSYTMAVDPVGSAFAALAEREKRRRVISVDPNLRPTVIADMARWANAAERFYRTATIVKASDEDVRLAWAGRMSIAEAAAYWISCGASLVVVTEGAKGATAFTSAVSISVPGHSVEVRDTVGAGDTFHAASLAWLAKNKKLNMGAIAELDTHALGELLAYANAAAAITVTRRGADLPTASELEKSLGSSANFSERIRKEN